MKDLNTWVNHWNSILLSFIYILAVHYIVQVYHQYVSDMSDDLLIGSNAGVEGMKSLSEALKINSTLTHLNLDSTQ